eukprot:6183582-Pleurochrysis_carterae.AAC.2
MSVSVGFEVATPASQRSQPSTTAGTIANGLFEASRFISSGRNRRCTESEGSSRGTALEAPAQRAERASAEQSSTIAPPPIASHAETSSSKAAHCACCSERACCGLRCTMRPAGDFSAARWASLSTGAARPSERHTGTCSVAVCAEAAGSSGCQRTA